MTLKQTDSGFKDWTPDQLPNLADKTYLITGGNAGIGIEAARFLAAADANIVVACRNADKGQQAVEEVSALGSGNVESLMLDLSSMTSVRSAAAEVLERYQKLDGLINNAGVMQTPETRTADGFELQLATNHLGHFLLAGLLFELVEKSAGRIVVVSSIAHKPGKIDFDDLMGQTNYSPSTAYTQSKLANLLFALELDRRLKTAGASASCIACHPGYSSTKLQSTGPKGLFNILYKVLNPLLAQPPEKGAIPTVLAAAGSEAVPGAYYGPQSLGEMRGPVSDANVAAQAQNEETAARLWTVSEELVQHKWLS